MRTLAPPATCAGPGCNAVLSAYREPGETLCSLCRRKAEEELSPAERFVVGFSDYMASALREPPRILEAEELVLAVAGVLALSRALRGTERVHVQRELERLGILADHVDVHLAIAKLRRRYGWLVDAIEGEAGYGLRRWPYRFRRRPRRGQLQLFGRL